MIFGNKFHLHRRLIGGLSSWMLGVGNLLGGEEKISEGYMKKIFIVLFVVFFTLQAGIDIAQASEKEYQLKPGDVLSISVWGFEELQVRELIVRDDGKISFPLVGEMKVAGLLPGEVTQGIGQALDGYISEPKVTVNIVKYHTTRIYVMGEVARPGLYNLEKQHNLMDAISIAGGYTKETAKKKVFIISQGGNVPVEANLLQLLQKGDMTQNIPLKDGDVVYLADNHRIDFTRDVLPFITGAYYIKNFDK